METTDLNLFVRTSEETISDWDRSKIVDALVRETLIDADTAKDERQLIHQGNIEVALRILDDLGRLGHLDRTGAMHASSNDRAVHLGHRIERGGIIA